MSSNTNILSFDCAEKTLAIAHLSVDFTAPNKLCSVVDLEIPELIKKLREIYEDYITVEQLWLIDLVPNQLIRNTTQFLRIARLKGVLCSIDRYLKRQQITNATILIEYQMITNDKTRSVASQIINHFSTPDIGYSCISAFDNLPVAKSTKRHFRIEYVQPTLKNKLSLGTDIKYSVFSKKYRSLYSANKNHAIANCKRYFDCIGDKNILKCFGSKTDDISDAVLQAIAWIRDEWLSLK